MNRNTLTVFQSVAYFATFRLSPAHVPNIYSWDGAALTTIAPATTGITDDDKVVVLSAVNFKGLCFIWGEKTESWGDSWFDSLYFGSLTIVGNPVIGFSDSWDATVQTFTAPIGNQGFFANQSAAPLVALTETSAMYFAANYYTDANAVAPAVIYENTGSPVGQFTLIDPGLADNAAASAFQSIPTYSYADGTGTFSWVLTTVPCTGVPWTQSSVDAIESVGFELDFYIGNKLIINRLGIEVDYTPIAITRNNKGCLNFLVS